MAPNSKESFTTLLKDSFIEDAFVAEVKEAKVSEVREDNPLADELQEFGRRRTWDAVQEAAGPEGWYGPKQDLEAQEEHGTGSCSSECDRPSLVERTICWMECAPVFFGSCILLAGDCIIRAR